MTTRVRLWLIALLLSGVLTGQAQPAQAPNGVIRLSTDSLSLAPLRGLLYPSLFEIAADDSLVFAAPGNDALVRAAERDGSTITLTLRDDLTWTDDVPVTPGEVIFTLIEHISAAEWASTVSGLRLLDDNRLSITFDPVSCAALPLLNTVVEPLHVRFRNLENLITTARDNGAVTLSDWQAAFRRVQNAPYRYDAAFVTAGQFTLVEASAEHIRLVGSGDYANLALQMERTPDVLSPVEIFLAGDTNLLPRDQLGGRVRDLRAAEVRQEIDLVEMLSGDAFVLLFNQADTTAPRDGFTRQGEREPQGENILTRSAIVREALALVLDRDELVERAFDGLAVPIYAPVSPASWAYPDDVAQEQPQLGMASTLLTQAGWRDTDRNGVRECVSCADAPLGTELRLSFVSDSPALGDLVSSQAARIGIRLEPAGDLALQTFDLALVRLSPPAGDPAQHLLFSPQGDRLYLRWWGLNRASVDMPEAAARIAEASTPDESGVCTSESRPRRAALYAEAYDLLLDQHVVIPLVTPLEIAAARRITGFQPRPADLFFGLQNWQIAADPPVTVSTGRDG